MGTDDDDGDDDDDDDDDDGCRYRGINCFLSLWQPSRPPCPPQENIMRYNTPLKGHTTTPGTLSSPPVFLHLRLHACRVVHYPLWPITLGLLQVWREELRT
jgi:hypothetical protein